MPRRWPTSTGPWPWARGTRPSPPGAASPWSGWAGTSEADAAFADGFAQAGGLAASARARLAWAYGFAIAARDPDEGPRGLRRRPAARPARCTGPLRSRHARHGAGGGRAGAPGLRPGARGRPRPHRGPPLPRHPAGPPGRVGGGDPRDQPVPRARAPVAGDALRGRVRRRPGLRGPRARPRPPRRRSTSSSGPGRGRRPVAEPPTTPTSPRSAGSRGSVAWSTAPGRPRPPVPRHRVRATDAVTSGRRTSRPHSLQECDRTWICLTRLSRASMASPPIPGVREPCFPPSRMPRSRRRAEGPPQDCRRPSPGSEGPGGRPAGGVRRPVPLLRRGDRRPGRRPRAGGCRDDDRAGGARGGASSWPPRSGPRSSPSRGAATSSGSP